MGGRHGCVRVYLEMIWSKHAGIAAAVQLEKAERAKCWGQR